MRLPARRRVEHAGVVGEPLLRRRRAARARRRGRRSRGSARPRNTTPRPTGVCTPGTPPTARTVVPGSTATAWRLHRRVADEDHRAVRGIELLAVERERGLARDDDVGLLVPERLLGVLLDDVVAGARRVRVDAERVDAERPPDRLPADARDRDRLDSSRGRLVQRHRARDTLMGHPITATRSRDCITRRVPTTVGGDGSRRAASGPGSRARVAHGSQVSPPVSQPSRTWVAISAATRSRNAGVGVAVDCELADDRSPGRTPAPPPASRRSAGARLRPEHERAVLQEQDSRPGDPAARAASAATTARRTSSASPLELEDAVRSPRRAPRAHSAEVRALELPHRRASALSGTGTGRRRPRVDQHERLRAGHHQLVVGQPDGGRLVRDTRPPDPADRVTKHSSEIVESRRCVVLDAPGRASRTRLLRPGASRGGGGTRCARGRSTAGSGRSRRRPGRRCPRTRRASAPST